LTISERDPAPGSVEIGTPPAHSVTRLPTQRRVSDISTATDVAAHGGPRLGFLDVLRGLAAMSVVAYHLANDGPVRTEWFWYFSHTVINLGSFGVLTFFFVSGFIIPASLERTGSVVEFWISRVFRLFPVFWLVSAAVVILYSLGALDLPEYIFRYKLFLFVGNVSLLSHFLGSSVLIGPGWTLPFEICFYLLTTVLFVTRLRGRSAGIAIAGAVLAVLAFDRIYPMWAVTPRSLGVDGHVGAPVRVVLTAMAVAVAAALLARSRATGLYAAVIGGGVTMLLLNRPWPLHQAAVYITIMFTGTVIYRMANGQLSGRKGWSVVGFVAAACALAFYIHTEPLITSIGEPRGAAGETWWTRSVAVLVAMAVFIVSYALRDRVRWPEWLQWLGRISYSLYLVHWVVVESVPGLPEGVPARGPLTLAMWLAITLGVSTLTYYFVETPAIAAGRRLVRWVRNRRATKSGADSPLATA
jgi:peptidoglycan/LPS O-acetylase OafA/YrhL